MSDAASDAPVIDNVDESRYEIRLDDGVALIDYNRGLNSISFIHTEVPQQLEGKGLAGRLAKHALDTARRDHEQVIPICAYVASYIDRHPEYQDLLRKSE